MSTINTDSGTDSSDPSQRHAWATEVGRLLDELPHHGGTALRLTYSNALSIPALAARLNMSTTEARQLLADALLRLGRGLCQHD